MARPGRVGIRWRCGMRCGLGDVFVVGNKGGGILWRRRMGGTGGWMGRGVKGGKAVLLRLAVGNETAAEMLDEAFLKGAWGVVGAGEEGEEGIKKGMETAETTAACQACGREEL